MRFPKILNSPTASKPFSLLLLISLLFTACSSFTGSKPPNYTELVSLHQGKNIGQTFVARFDGLRAVEIYIESQESGGGKLVLTVWDNPTETSQKISQATLHLDQITSQGSYILAFEPQDNSTNEYYYIDLTIEGQGSILVGVKEGFTYYNHSIYMDREPKGGQLAFSPHYDQFQWVFGLIVEGLNWIIILIIGLFLFVIPGWAILSLTLTRWKILNWKVKLGLSAGMSSAIYPVLLLWTDLFGIHLGVWYAWLPAIAGAAVILWRNRSAIPLIRPTSAKRIEKIGWQRLFTDYVKDYRSWLPDVIFLSILLLVFVTRFWHIRNLDAPMWGDSYQHTMIAQLLVDNAGLFSNWEPYVPYYSLTVHFGFPVAVAILSWLTNFPVVNATLLTGQLLNIIAIITLVPLASRFGSKQRWAGISVILTAGLLSLMPAYYVNWGRYAQLAGLGILPVTLWLVWEIAGAPQKITDKRSLFIQFITILLSGILITGMVLSYYRMIFYLVFFVIAWLLAWGIPEWKWKIALWLRTAITLIAVAVTSFVIIMPWVSRISGSHLAGEIGTGISIGSTLEGVLADYQFWRQITSYIPLFLLIMVSLALLVAVIRKRWIIFLLPLWILLLTLYIGGQLLNLPGANMIQSFSILISLYIPISIIAGWLIDDGILLINWGKSIPGTFAILIIFISLGLWGALNLRSISQPENYALIRRPDIHAMSWIQENIPNGERILVEGFTINNAQTAVGSDAGWWISLLAGKENSMPPQYALVFEIPLPRDYSEEVVNLTAGLEDSNLGTQTGLGIICDHNISHIYIGQVQGKIGSGVQQLFSPQELINSSYYKLIYHQDRVYIFSLMPGVCETDT